MIKSIWDKIPSDQKINITFYTGVACIILGLIGIAQGLYFAFYLIYATRYWGGWAWLGMLAGLFSTVLIYLGGAIIYDLAEKDVIPVESKVNE